jgi:NAD(P)H-nitrite reductase large subunit
MRRLYRKILFDGERIVGFLLTGDITRAGIFTNLLKNRIPIGKLKDEAINTTASLSGKRIMC